MADENRTPTPTGDNMAPPQGAQLGPDDEPRRINLTFNGSNGESVAFKVKSTMKLGKAMDHYSARVQTDPQQLRFLFDGTRLQPDHTPAMVRPQLLTFSQTSYLQFITAGYGGQRHHRSPHGADRRRR